MTLSINFFNNITKTKIQVMRYTSNQYIKLTINNCDWNDDQQVYDYGTFIVSHIDQQDLARGS